MASGPLWGLPAGQGDWEDLWRGWGTQWPPLPPVLRAYPVLPCCGLLPAPSLSLLAQPVWASCELCRWPPSAPSRVASEASWRAKAASGASGSAGCRESTGALKAWLGRHRQNPYPTKGEKVLLALLSRMSLTQVSTWFANARRRLKKERRPHPGPHPGPAPHDAPTPPAHQPRRQQEDDEEEEEEEEEDQPPRKQAKIWSLAELAAPAAAVAPGIQQ